MANNRVVIDTNVFISSILGQYSYPYKIFDELILTGEVKLCLSQEVLKEYEEVACRAKFQKIPHFSGKAQKLLSAMKEIAIIVKTEESISKIKDDPDNRILELAVAAQAIAIVTGNSRDFTFEEFRGIKIQSPKDFYEEHTS